MYGSNSIEFVINVKYKEKYFYLGIFLETQNMFIGY